MQKMNEFGYEYYIADNGDIYIACNECGKLISTILFEDQDGLCTDCWRELYEG